MQASGEDGGRSRSQYSQFGRSSRAIIVFRFHAILAGREKQPVTSAEVPLLLLQATGRAEKGAAHI